MPRADHLLNLVRAGAGGDHPGFQKALEALIVDERGKQHHLLADRLAAHLSTNAGGRPTNTPRTWTGSERFFHSLVPERRLADLILAPPTVETVEELLEEHRRADLLRAHNLEPRHRVLLLGPPGNGKTSLAEAIATELAVPLFSVRYESVIASYLGETGARLDRLFAEVRTHSCVLFFDEFDVVGKARGDEHETGEIKRVVSSLLLQIDALPSRVVVVTATNHPELLDRAVWRRFQIRLDLAPPTPEQTTEWFHRFEAGFETPLPESPAALAKRLAGLSFSDLESFSLEVKRRCVLDHPETDSAAIVRGCLERWRRRHSPRDLARPVPRRNDGAPGLGA